MVGFVGGGLSVLVVETPDVVEDVDLFCVRAGVELGCREVGSRVRELNAASRVVESPASVQKDMYRSAIFA